MILDVTARTLSPLAMSIRRATGNDLDSLTYIPGSTVRGALAYAWLDANGQPAGTPPRFKEIFLSGNTRFGSLCIGGASPAPASARRCSRAPEDHLLVDHLLQRAARAPVGEQCACGAKRQRVPGYLLSDRQDGFVEKTVQTRRIAHTAIDPRLLRAANQQFHTARVITEDQTFLGAIHADDSVATELEDLIRNNAELYFGRGRTRGQGFVRMTVTARNSPVEVTAQQLQDFNAAVGARFPKLRDRFLFSCTFHSMTIMLDEWLMSRSSPESADLDPAECWAIAAGSSYLFASAGAASNVDANELAAALSRAMRSGIGERTMEGFGEVVFCHAFHTENAEA